VTAILAIEHAEGVVLATDSAVSDDADKWVEDAPKAFRVGDVWLALSGGVREALLAESVSTPRGPRRGERDVVYLTLAVAEPIRRLHDEAKADGAGDGVIVWRGRVYLLDREYGVVRPAGGLAWAGSGGPVARAAALALHRLPARRRAQRALEIACEVCVGVAPPVHLLDC
jgi:ATP-dependent protease HslVU (ClpYQ) peptidase subunit